MIFKLFIFVVALCIACVESRPEGETRILKFDNDVRLDGYNFAFETSDGISRQENAVFQPISKDEGILTVNGESSFPLQDNIPFNIKFTADDKGYRPIYVIGQGGTLYPSKKLA